jgi:hypothetical protein
MCALLFSLPYEGEVQKKAKKLEDKDFEKME